MEFTLLFSAFFGVAGLYALLYWEAKRGNAADCTRDIWDIAVAAAVVGLFAGRIAAMIGDGVNPVTHPGDIVIVRAGVATGPAALFTLTTLAVLARRELAAVADGLSAAALAGLGGWHAGCLTRDACLGTPSDLPWAFNLAGSPISRHPVELYAAVAFISLAGALAWAKAHRRLPRLVPAGFALAVAGAVRLATEPMRPALSGSPEIWYWAAIVAGSALAAYGVRTRRRTVIASPN